jgi:hypothetical protein
MKKGGPRHTTIVAHVVEKVEKLWMQDKENPRKIANDSIMICTNNNTNTSDKEGTQNQDSTTYTKAAIDNTDKEINNTSKTHEANSSTTLPAKRVSWKQLQHALDMAAVVSRVKVPEVGVKRNEEERKHYDDARKVGSVNRLAKKEARWKRIQKGTGSDSPTRKLALTTQVGDLGAPRIRPRLEEEDADLQPALKRKIILPVPSLEESLGKENLRKMREEEKMYLSQNVRNSQGKVDMNSAATEGSDESLDILVDNNSKENLLIGKESRGGSQEGEEEEPQSVKESEAKEKQHGQKGGKDATGPGATEELQGANESTWQDK